MRTDPFTASFRFLLGETGDHEALGWGRWVIAALFLALLAASALIARASWSADPAQRTPGHL